MQNNPTAAPTLLSMEKVSKTYPEGRERRVILNEADLSVEQGEFLAVVGKSGSGKTTLLNVLSGIDRLDSGRIVWDGVTFSELNDQQKTLFRRKNIGFVFQFFNLIPTLTVWDNLTLPLNLNGMTSPQDLQRAEQLLAEVGLADRRADYPDRLSGGEQQRVALVRALVHDPKLVLADEPTGNLDEDTGTLVLNLLDRLTRQMGKGMVMVTHSLDAAARADRIVRLKEGRFIADGEGRL
ncbi:MAG TPA: ABC transporter ATP-binding protein [Bellilinea sp.]|nr:ABC transporter ATP-binding protein [Bellilinea sp.]